MTIDCKNLSLPATHTLDEVVLALHREIDSMAAVNGAPIPDAVRPTLKRNGFLLDRYKDYLVARNESLRRYCSGDYAASNSYKRAADTQFGNVTKIIAEVVAAYHAANPAAMPTQEEQDIIEQHRAAAAAARAAARIERARAEAAKKAELERIAAEKKQRELERAKHAEEMHARQEAERIARAQAAIDKRAREEAQVRAELARRAQAQQARAATAVQDAAAATIQIPDAAVQSQRAVAAQARDAAARQLAARQARDAAAAPPMSADARAMQWMQLDEGEYELLYEQIPEYDVQTMPIPPRVWAWILLGFTGIWLAAGFPSRKVRP